MAVEITVPVMGESITEAVVGKWHKKAGDAVNADEPVVVLETDKVTIDVPAPAAGTLAGITHAEGDKVKVGDVLGTLSAGAGAPKAAPAAPVAATAPEPAPAAAPATGSADARGPALTPVARKLVEENRLDPASIHGSGPGGRILKEDVLGHLGGNGKAAPAATPVQAPVARAPQAPSGPRANASREERV
jgi:2-oxoglutarate dehydrogenase E2 component (dihydrolipoamide succinyltransferase)